MIGNDPSPIHELDQTKAHVISAGRELLYAAQGALRFCKHYAEISSEPTRKKEVVHFFTRAISTADDFGRGLMKTSLASRAAHIIATPILTAIGQEMSDQSRRRGKL